jgi:hypothetical protein
LVDVALRGMVQAGFVVALVMLIEKFDRALDAGFEVRK